jgi:hypothetical protein
MVRAVLNSGQLSMWTLMIFLSYKQGPVNVKISIYFRKSQTTYERWGRQSYLCSLLGWRNTSLPTGLPWRRFSGRLRPILQSSSTGCFPLRFSQKKVKFCFHRRCSLIYKTAAKMIFRDACGSAKILPDGRDSCILSPRQV